MGEELRALFDSVAHRTTLSFEQFASAVTEYKIVPVVDVGEIIGAVMVRGPELHVGVKRTPKASTRKMFTKIFGDCSREYGYAETAVLLDNQDGMRLCERLGFTETKRDERAIYYRKEMPC